MAPYAMEVQGNLTKSIDSNSHPGSSTLRLTYQSTINVGGARYLGSIAYPGIPALFPSWGVHRCLDTTRVCRPRLAQSTKLMRNLARAVGLGTQLPGTG